MSLGPLPKIEVCRFCSGIGSVAITGGTVRIGGERGPRRRGRRPITSAEVWLPVRDLMIAPELRCMRCGGTGYGLQQKE
jgi:hypothetical protein